MNKPTKEEMMQYEVLRKKIRDYEETKLAQVDYLEKICTAIRQDIIEDKNIKITTSHDPLGTYCKISIFVSEAD